MTSYPFWKAIRSVIWGMFGRVNIAADAGRPIDSSSMMAAAAETADIWFTPDLVKDYQEADFHFLTAGERAALTRTVVEFRELTADLPPGARPTPEQIARGYNLLSQINNTLAPHFGEEPDLRRIADATRPIRWPEFVRWWDYRLGNDSTGDPAVWVWLVIDDDVEIESPAVQAELDRVRDECHAALQRAGIDRWPYIRLIGRSEATALGRGPGLVGGRT